MTQNQDAVGRPRNPGGPPPANGVHNVTIVTTIMERKETRQGPRAGEGNMSFTEDNDEDGEISPRESRPRKQEVLKGKN